jgi:hypothetical protein
MHLSRCKSNFWRNGLFSFYCETYRLVFCFSGVGETAINHKLLVWCTFHGEQKVAHNEIDCFYNTFLSLSTRQRGEAINQTLNLLVE